MLAAVPGPALDPGRHEFVPMSAVTTVLIVPGVGLWPELCAETADRLDDGEAITTRIVERRTDRLAFDAQVGDLADLCGRAGPSAIVVGVSGGATLALALAGDRRRPDELAAIVTHEPLVGALQADLDQRVGEAGRRLRAEPSERAALSFVAGLYGSAWHRLAPSAEAWARDHHDVICAEVAEFASFQPSEQQLASPVPHLTTVGASSDPQRHAVAALLERHGAEALVIDDCGHLVLTEAPVAFATAISTFVDSIAKGPS